jgi:hypothetical protein
MTSLSSSLPFILARHLAETAANNETAQDGDGIDSDPDCATTASSFNPTVFWSVNAFIFFMLLVACLSCRYGNKFFQLLMFSQSDHRARTNSDLAFVRHQMARDARAAAAAKETPARRKQRLLDSFRRCQVAMVR